MKHKYLLAAFLVGALSQQAQAQTTAWRPFRPGRVYKFLQTPSLATFAQVRTLRVDSAYATASGDSVYTFNRLLRQPSSPGAYLLKSRNNLFGARLRWRPGSSDYYLEANAEPALGGAAQPVVLLMRPRAAVGSSWAASTQPALTATLTSRTAAFSTADSVAVITLSSGQQLAFSRTGGLVQGPQWLTVVAAGTAAPLQWGRYEMPQPGLDVYDPRNLFKMGVGDEIGYTLTLPYLSGPLLCQSGYRLRRITSRLVTADSLMLTYREQDLVTTSTVPGCGGQPGTVLSVVRQGRWAFSLQTGASPQFPFLPLLTGEYRLSPAMGNPGALATGQLYSVDSNSNFCLNDSRVLSFATVYPSAASPGQYVGGIDAQAINQRYTPDLGMGPVFFNDAYQNQQVYYRKGTTLCGSPANFATLLPSRAAQAAAAATLHPNPATEAATLTLAAPTLPGSTLALVDALGRRVWRTELAAGQTAILVPLASQATGLYLVQLLAPSAAPLTWKLNKQ
ncbi:MAG: T9SS type A sorting domain-containing protein [Hymenobacter sp.]|nr:MAG: T9SS type A sorting domain-containing protein [Hymenobacter sp.]